MRKPVFHINPEMFESIAGHQYNKQEPELREMLIKGMYYLYFCDDGREFFFEKKVENSEDIPAIKKEAFETLVLFKAEHEGITFSNSELEPND